ncbi:DODA-type extradiol aromatic ring-opening family dioxygenase [Celerinatantimonas sp. YJH-8]|uniref:DODA-type extradiol aromatic ring-opening family dioxygenase n=1 Tax=Celerinatantimonas sp. YJH-8 TaxID=3228714 RepID=UPI0038C69247
MYQFPTFFVSHGGGPWPWMSEFGHAYDELAASLTAIPGMLEETPKALLVVTGHWESQMFKISSAAQPGMIYDYYGFPDYTYQIQYPAPGAPDLAAQIQQLLADAKIEASLDPKRGLDHGTFTPLQVMYPQANIPVVQLSLRSDLDPEIHYQVGKALRSLRQQGVLIIGSGLSYHNLRRFDVSAREPSRQFDDWLNQTLALPEKPRHLALAHWEFAPSARIAHPREEHLLPLWVALGAASDGKMTNVYRQHDLFGGISSSSFRFD